MPVVTIRILNDEPSPEPVEDIVVQFYSTAGVFQTSGTTDVDGEVEVTLPVAFYDIYCFKVGVTLLPKQPQRIEVIDPGSNEFEIECHVRVLPESTNPRCCTVSGRILGVGGGPAIHRLIFEPKKHILSLYGDVIALNHRLEVSSDVDGYFEFELLRDVEYCGYFLFPEDFFCQQPGKLDIVVPDLPAVRLDRLMFPVPVDVDFSSTAIALVAGATQDESITATISFSDGSERTSLSTPWAYIKVENTDNLVVEASISGTKLCLKPLAAGVATITTTRVMGTSSIIDPVDAFTTESVTVTVS